MGLTEKIQASVQKLPSAYQAEVLDFVEYLLEKTRRENPEKEDNLWSGFSLTVAMRGMEEESNPEYTEADLKTTFS